MNQHLQNIQNIIQEDKSLTGAEKDAISKLLKEADKELEITAFKLERTEKVKKTTAILLEETIEELEQKRKAVEAQNRKLEIESSLERVRTVAMSMYKPADMLDVCRIISEQLETLGTKEIRNVQTAIFHEDKGTYTNYEYYRLHDKSLVTEIDYRYNAMTARFATQMQKDAGEFFTESFTEKTLEDWLEYQKTTPQFVDTHLSEASSLNYYWFSLGPIALGISTYSPLNDDGIIVFKRFRNVFELSYRRFLDVEKAEAQAKEAQIELALERVRARTMAMQRSDELSETASEMFRQILLLGLETWSCGFNIIDKESNLIRQWVSTGDGRILPSFVTPSDEDVFERFTQAAQEDKSLYVEEMGGEVLKAHYQYMASLPEVKKLLDEFQSLEITPPDFQVFNLASFTYGYLMFITYQPAPEFYDVFKRFAAVFDQTYRRFLDLQKAEAQSREAQIELGLERVRARAMAMQKSEELGEISFELVNQVQSLGVATWHCAFNIYDEDQNSSTEWGSNAGGTYPTYKTPREGIFLKYYEIGQTVETLHVEVIGEDKCADHYTYLCTLPGVGEELLKLKDAGVPFPTSQIDHVAYFKYGYLLFITYEPIPEAHDIFKRFAKVFEQTYTRFLDLQKAEAQAREAKIEAALERVRSKTMAMHKSDELAEVINVVSEQLHHLGFEIDNVNFNLNFKGDDFDLWMAAPGRNYPTKVHIPYIDHPIMNRFNKARAEGLDFFADNYLHSETKTFFHHVFKNSILKNVPEDRKNYVLQSAGFSRSVVLMKHIALSITKYSSSSYTDEENAVFKRFAAVFEQTYTRFLDLQKAEAQAREAQIEAALEKVRSRTMAMQRSHELREAANIMFQQVKALGVPAFTCGYNIWERGDKVCTAWMSSEDGLIQPSFTIPLTEMPTFIRFHESRQKGEAFYIEAVEGEVLADHYRYMQTLPLFGEIIGRFLEAGFTLPKFQINHVANFTHGNLIFITNQPVPEAWDIFKRFAAVFEQTYTRFLDLQKAEAQAREAQIEAALERVRARVQAMRFSGDLIEVANVLRDQLGQMGQPELESCIVHLYPENSETYEVWYAFRPPGDTSGEVITGTTIHHINSSEWTREVIEKYRSPENEYTIESSGKKLKEWYTVLEKVAPEVVEYDANGVLVVPEVLFYHFSKFSGGSLLMISNQKPSDVAKELQRRAASVFDMGFQRYLDLVKAEAQAREAKIEASLERVRGRAMAMHSSEDLSFTIGVFYRELETLSVTPRRCGVGLLDKETHIAELSTMNTDVTGASIEIIGKIKMVGHPVLEGIYENWLLQKEYHPVLWGNEIKEYYQLLKPQISFPGYPDDVVQYGYFFFFDEGGVYTWTGKELEEDELKIYRRFTSVLSLTYKRYKELRDAELRTQVAIRQSSLDRIRGEIASMRTTDDLQRITPSVWKELNALGVPFFRCGVFIVDEQNSKVHSYLSTPGGEPIGVLHLDFDSSDTTANLVSSWQEQQVYRELWNRDQFKLWVQSMLDQDQIKTANTYQAGDAPPESLALQFVPFAQGMMYVGSADVLNDGQVNLVHALAETFSTAYARYEDFNKLENAKQQIELTLLELKAAQTQLIQSEKMASLGQLTAGIAHEIQNPLNFINNFSDVNYELIEEMKIEFNAGNKEEALAIADDIRKNEQKINHHGKRADAIVKGMLQHSRTSTGQKEPTDINALADEYLRLSYYGFKAKDKNFKATINNQYYVVDQLIPLVPQDIGRVLLNLYNNAFYTMAEKKKLQGDVYEPGLWVSTKIASDRLEVSVRDNGLGIQQKVLDKIFQPFFTTKPTGQGTGLGLSLSYDIIKAHNGELNVATEEGEGSEFVIVLPAL